MKSTPKCRSCGKPLPPNPDRTAGGICPACQMVAGAETQLMEDTGGMGRPESGGALFRGAAALAPGSTLAKEGHDAAEAYTLIEKLGQGGYGEVWRASQSKPVRREVALKILQTSHELSDHAVARFRAEGQALALMDHPHIARFYDAGQFEDGRLFCAIELVGSTGEDGKWCPGMPLTKYCDAHRMGLRERLEVFADVCRAVAGAHQKGIIHRDLKPENILVGEADGKAVPKVIDFGLAKDITGEDALDLSKLTVESAGVPMGTFLFMSPEQAGGTAVDTRTDVYALGAILYDLLTGSPPLTGEMLRAAMYDERIRMIREQEAPKPSTRVLSLEDPQKSTTATGRSYSRVRGLSAALRGDLDWIALKALDKEPARRHEGVIQLAEDVEAYVSGNALPHAAPPSRAYRMKKFVRRHRVPVAAAAAVVLALVGGVTVSIWQAVRATRAEADALEEKTKALWERDAAEKAQRAAESAEDVAAKERDRATSIAEYVVYELHNELSGSSNPEIVEEVAERLSKLYEDQTDTDPIQQLRIRGALLTNKADAGIQKGEYEGARALQLEALTLAQRAHQARPADQNLLRDLAVCHSNLGETYLALGDESKAERELEASLELLISLNDKGERQVNRFHDVIVALIKLGQAKENLEKNKEARNLYTQAKNRLNELLPDQGLAFSVDALTSYLSARIDHLGARSSRDISMLGNKDEIADGLIKRMKRFKTRGIWEATVAKTVEISDRIELRYTVFPESKVTLEHAVFPLNSGALSNKESIKELRALATALLSPELQELHFVVEVHTSAHGEELHNRILSQRRAEEVVRMLVAFGVRSERLVAVGIGESEAIPLHRDGTESATHSASATQVNGRPIDGQRIVIYQLKGSR